MKVDLTQFEGTSLPFDFTVSAEELDLEGEDFTIVGDLNVAGEVTKDLVQTNVKGSIAGRVSAACTRCLNPVERDVNIPFDVAYVAPENYPEEKEVEVPKGELELSVFDGEHIDLKEVAREQILLEEPEQTFCRSDCKGLCPTCGTDLNTGTCDCGKDDIDPRWAALKNLK